MNPNYFRVHQDPWIFFHPFFWAAWMVSDPNDELFWVKKGTPNDSLSHPKPIKVKGMMLNRQIMF